MKSLAPLVLLTCGAAAQSVPQDRIPLPQATGIYEKVFVPTVTTDTDYEHTPAPVAEPRSAPPRPVSPEDKPAVDAARPGIAAALADPTLVLFDQPDEDGPLWALGANYKASFDKDGWSFIAHPAKDAPDLQPIRFRLTAARVGARALAVDGTAPRRAERRVEMPRGDVLETVILDGLGVEQTFTFATLPQRGAIVLTLDLDTALDVTLTGEALAFHSAWVDVDWSAPVAIDADGNRIDADTELVDGKLEIRVPASFVEHARLPLVVDPKIASRAGLATSATDVGSPDIVWRSSTNDWAVTFEKFIGGNDFDIYVQRLDAAFVPVGNLIVIDGTTTSWRAPRIAYVRATAKSLVVAEVRTNTSSLVRVWGRVVFQPGTVGGVIDIAATSSALNRNATSPDVGGDPSGFVPSMFTVVWEHHHSATDHDIHARQINTDDSLRGTGPIFIQTATTNQTAPAISKSNGAPPNTTQRWTVVFEHHFTATNHDIHAALLTWDGQIVLTPQATFAINSSTFDHRFPQVSSPSLPDGAGNRRIVAVYENPGSNGGDVLATCFMQDGTILAGLNVNLFDSNSAILAWPQLRPSVDCDGLRFGVGYYRLFNGIAADFDTNMTLLSSVGSALIVEEAAAILGQSAAPEFDIQVAAKYSSTGTFDEAIGTTNDRELGATAHAIDAFLYADRRTGTMTTRATGCGSLAITALGSPTPGAPLSFSLNAGGASAGFIYGIAATIPLTGLCDGCALGANNGGTLPGQNFAFTIPLEPGVIGTFISLQGYMLSGGGGPCLGAIHLSDTVDIATR